MKPLVAAYMTLKTMWSLVSATIILDIQTFDFIKELLYSCRECSSSYGLYSQTWNDATLQLRFKYIRRSPVDAIVVAPDWTRNKCKFLTSIRLLNWYILTTLNEMVYVI